MNVKKTTEKAATKEKSLPKKRAEFKHMDFGYVIDTVEGDAPAVRETYKKLEGIFDKIQGFKDAGFEVKVEGADNVFTEV